MTRRDLLYTLAAWAVLSATIFTLAVGFAGGLEHVFSQPEGDAVSVALFVIVWAFILVPVVALPAALLIRHKK